MFIVQRSEMEFRSLKFRLTIHSAQMVEIMSIEKKKNHLISAEYTLV